MAIYQMKINNVFLNWDLVEEVYMQQPKGFIDLQKPQFVCKLRKELYDLKQTPRAWFERLKNVLLLRGFMPVISNSNLFILGSSKLGMYIFIYVDDILLTRPNATYVYSLIQDLNFKFSLKDLGELNFFLGIEAYENQKGLLLTQIKCAPEL